MKDPNQHKNPESYTSQPAEEVRVPTPKPAVAKLTKCTRLNVRSARSATAPVAGVISENDRIKINKKNSDSTWSEVLEPVYGFAKSEFLEVT